MGEETTYEVPETTGAADELFERDVKELEGPFEKELDIMKDIRERIIDTISLMQHRDLATLIKDSSNSMNKIMKIRETLDKNKEMPVEKKAELCKKLDKSIVNIDKNFLISLFTITRVIRSIALYYHTRMKSSEVYEELMEHEHLKEIAEREKKAHSYFHHAVKDLEKTTRWRARGTETGILAEGELVNAIKFLGEVGKLEKIEFGNLFMKDAAGGRVAKELKE